MHEVKYLPLNSRGAGAEAVTAPSYPRYFPKGTDWTKWRVKTFGLAYVLFHDLRSRRTFACIIGWMRITMTYTWTQGWLQAVTSSSRSPWDQLPINSISGTATAVLSSHAATQGWALRSTRTLMVVTPCHISLFICLGMDVGENIWSDICENLYWSTYKGNNGVTWDFSLWLGRSSGAIVL